MRTPLLASSLLSLGACVATPGVHPSLHPSAPGAGPSAGVALGGFVQTSGGETNLLLGYGEGWARLGSTGALELRTTPQAAFVAYDVPVASGGASMSVRPSLGLAVTRFNVNDANGSSPQTTAQLHPGVSFVVQKGAVYAAPRVGLSQVVVLEGDGDGDTAYSFGATVGYRVSATMTAELTGVFSDSSDETAEAVWSIVPTLGISVGK